MDDVDRIIAGLSQKDREAIEAAEPADSCEYWMLQSINRPDLHGSDLVLTPLGEAVRQRLQDRGK